MIEQDDRIRAAARWSAVPPMRLGLVSVLVLVFGLGGWSALASISGAVVAQGRVKVASERQVVQHLDGGVVAVLNVREGDRVGAGDVLMRFDDTRKRAELAIVETRLMETLARIGRLEAEQDLSEHLRFAPELLEAAAQDPEIEAVVAGQRRLWHARLARTEREVAQAQERIAQIREEAIGIEAQRLSLQRQNDLIERELRGQQTLYEKGLTAIGRVLALEREVARLEGEVGALTARMAEAEGRITEIAIQLGGREAARVEEAITQLRDLRAEESELRERRLDLLEVIERLDVRAPRNGIVIGLTIFTLRAVVRPADPILYIVPTEEMLVIEVRIRAADIDQVYPAQPARLRFSAFNSRIVPEIDATIMRVAPDAVEDPRTGEDYYAAELAISKEDIAALDGLVLVAGMPVDAYIQTGGRTPLSYLTQPLTELLAKAMRER